MRSLFTGTRGFAGIMLVLIIVWALAAVLMLTGTIIAANRIDDSVAIIKPTVSDIQTDTRLVALAKKTERISSQIERAAAPLTGELTQTLTAARGIERTAKSIDNGLRTTFMRAETINGNVLSIGGTVGQIGGNVDEIGGTVGLIGGNARSINASARSILTNAAQINGSARGIRSKGSTILGRVRTIDGRVAGINNRAITIREIATSLGTDLSTVLGIVGRQGTRDPRSITGHANSIDCSSLFVVTGGNDACNR